MKSKIIQQAKQLCENNKKITFYTFTMNDWKNFDVELGCFSSLEPEFHNGIKLIFKHKNKENKIIKFMTIIWIDDIVNHFNVSFNQILSNLINKKLRVYQGIFDLPYFDYADQCFPNKLFKVKSNN